jgi:Anti-sigma factor NepR
MYSDMAENNPKSKVRRHIDENLRRIYDETLNEQIPDKLTQLLELLRQKTAMDAKDGNAEDQP